MRQNLGHTRDMRYWQPKCLSQIEYRLAEIDLQILILQTKPFSNRFTNIDRLQAKTSFRIEELLISHFAAHVPYSHVTPVNPRSMYHVTRLDPPTVC